MSCTNEQKNSIWQWFGFFLTLNVSLVLLDVEFILTHPVISAQQEIPVSV